MKIRTHYITCVGLAPAAAVLMSTLPGHAAGQSIRGHVIDADHGASIVAAEVTVAGADGSRTAVLTDETGAFVARLDGGGTFTFTASSLGYVPSTTTVEIESIYQQVDVLVRLATSPVELEGITVVARGTDLRHRATFAGFLEREGHAFDVGPARIVSRDDGILRSSSNLSHLMEWFQQPPGCIQFFVDGHPTRFYTQISFASTADISLVDITGVEYYRHVLDAPLEFRGRGTTCDGTAYSVIALWRKRAT